MNKAAHFGNITTSRNESSHAAIKTYLRYSTGDHKHFFDAICIFWEDQHRNIKQEIAQQKMRPRNLIKIQFFHDVIGSVHAYALLKILDEKAKLPRKLTDALPLPCNCSIEQSMGLPCFHTIHARQRNPGILPLSDIDPHWHYEREGGEQPHLGRRILLEPSIVKGKGRPKVSTIKPPLKVKGYGVSSTRRDPSLFEHEDFELPSSTAPPRLKSARPLLSTPIIIDDNEPPPPQLPIKAQGARSKWDTYKLHNK